ncbi:MAG: GH3 auxin-responsive promoter family protein [Muribaculum sp.]|nr:GH3 auxin-responsive promoter family protein [Muribaculum sp.]
MSITDIIRPLFIHRVNAWNKKSLIPEKTQRDELTWLLGRASDTQQGRTFHFPSIRSYEEYREKLPVVQYPDIRHQVEKSIRGEKNILWPGKTTHFAQSSGTSDGKSKYIPITPDSFRRTHYRGGFDVVAHYLDLYPDSKIFDGKSFILGGSYANELTLPKNVVVGDLSANLIDNINPLANLVRIPSKRVALMEDWSKKLPALVEASINCNVTNISGVPSWFLTVIKEILKKTGATTIHEVWPNLEVFFHGGISFEPYRETYSRLTDPTKMRFLETYNASEGFFAVRTDPDDPAMTLLTDLGIFFEFVPLGQENEKFPEALGAWEVSKGETYSLVISGCNGLWRYAIGDTVTVTDTNPVKIIIAGRTKHFINAFGEELMVHNAEAAIAKTCSELECSVLNFTAAPVYAGDKSRGRHQWLIEFARPPKDIEIFADTLDKNIQNENSDYQAKRAHGLFLDRLSIVTAKSGLFEQWLAATGKLGGQRKVPRLSNDRHIIDDMLQLNQ